MKSNCGKRPKDLNRWLDGETKPEESRALKGHIEMCVFCQEEIHTLKVLNTALRSAQEIIQLSSGFDETFWKKVSERQRLPWAARLLNGLGALIPVPNFRQALAFIVLAFFIGNVTGITSGFAQRNSTTEAPAAIQVSSIVQETNGILSYSLAGAYLKMANEEISK